jgi:hypothetical protein
MALRMRSMSIARAAICRVRSGGMKMGVGRLAKMGAGHTLTISGEEGDFRCGCYIIPGILGCTGMSRLERKILAMPTRVDAA